MKHTIDDQQFKGINYTHQTFIVGEYDGCTFTNCNFSDVDLSNNAFIDCDFDGCNLSNAKLMNCALNSVRFKNCKLLGLSFNDCNKFVFVVNFRNCNLSMSSFFQVKLKATKFTACELCDVDFVEADLTLSSFDDCNLNGAVFMKTILFKADLETAINYSIDPNQNIIKKARFSRHGIHGLLDQFNITIKE